MPRKNNKFDYIKDTKLKYQDKEYARKYHSEYSGKLNLSRLKHKIVAYREIKIVRDLIDSINAGNKIRILDIPCGTGKLFPIFLKRGFLIYAADISKEMLSCIPKEHIKPQVKEIKTLDATRVGYKDGFFEIVICLRLLHRVPHKLRKRIIKELSRVSSSYIILSVGELPFITKMVHSLKELFRDGKTLPSPATHNEILDLAKKNNLVIKKRKPVFRFLSTEHIYLLEKCAE